MIRLSASSASLGEDVNLGPPALEQVVLTTMPPGGGRVIARNGGPEWNP